MFERTLDEANKGKESSLNNGDAAPGSNIEKYRRQKDFIETINIKLWVCVIFSNTSIFKKILKTESELK